MTDIAVRLDAMANKVFLRGKRPVGFLIGLEAEPGRLMLTATRGFEHEPFMHYDVVTHPESIENPFLPSTPET